MGTAWGLQRGRNFRDYTAQEGAWVAFVAVLRDYSSRCAHRGSKVGAEVLKPTCDPWRGEGAWAGGSLGPRVRKASADLKCWLHLCS